MDEYGAFDGMGIDQGFPGAGMGYGEMQMAGVDPQMGLMVQQNQVLTGPVIQDPYLAGGGYANQFGGVQQPVFGGQAGYNGMSQELDMMCQGYNSMAPFVADYPKLTSLGFAPSDIQMLENMVRMNRNRMPTAPRLYEMGIDYNKSAIFRYMYGISTGKIVIDSWEAMAKHFRRMWVGPHIGIDNLPVSTATNFRRFCLVAHLPKPYDVLDSARYVKKLGLSKAMYVVDKSGSKATVIRSNRRPIIRFDEPTTIEGHVKFLGVNKDDGTLSLAITDPHVRLCNRYIVVASLRHPADHLGCNRILCADGTTVYVFAQMLKGGANSYYNQAQRAYAYGVDDKLLPSTLQSVTEYIFKCMGGMMVENMPGNLIYNLMLDNEQIIEARKQAEEAALADSYFDSLE